jgi:tetratricopeptide (TPR) repeat protein
MFSLLAWVWILCSVASSQQAALDWREEVRKCAETQDWTTALRIVDGEIARAPSDMDVRAWRARVLAWSGSLVEAEQEYKQILAIAPNDPDHWVGMANVYSRQGRGEDAIQAIDRAVELDPQRADLHAARARALRALHRNLEAKLEFRRSLDLNPASLEARNGLLSLRGEPKHELRLGVDNDLFNFTGANQAEGVSLSSQWTPHWRTSVAASSYQRAGMDAEKFTGSLTARSPKWGALTAGVAKAHDNGVIPSTEAFFDIDHGWRLGTSGWLRGLEVVYGQHWYWYTTARILTLNETTIFYLPHEFTWSVVSTGARSSFPVVGTEWRPSGTTKLGFPLTRWRERRLGGNVFFAVGTENFAQVDQIGRFSSQTYGGGLRFQFSAGQDVTSYAAYQRRTQDRTQTSFGFTYGIHF